MSGIEDGDMEAITQDPEKAAKLYGCEVFYPEKNQLTVDIDNELQYGVFLKRILELQEVADFEGVVTQMPSKSGLPHRHIVVTCSRDFSDIQKIALQFALGSDTVRETLNLWRVLQGIDNPSRFFQPKPVSFLMPPEVL